MPDSDIIDRIKEVGGVFKFGSGVLGKSAIALAVLLVAVIVAAARLHSDGAILAVIGVGAVIFFAWFAYVLRFASNHPDVALLEGAEWSGWKKFEASAKGFVPQLPEKEPAPMPGSQAVLPGSKLTLNGNSELQDEEPKL